MWFPWEFTTTHVYSMLEKNFVREYRKKIKLFKILGAYLESHVYLAYTLLILKPLLVESVGYLCLCLK